MIILFSCKEEPENNTDHEKVAAGEFSNSIKEKDILALKYTDFGLSVDAQKAVEDWQKYQELITQINLLLEADLTFFKAEITLISTFLNDLKTELPKNLETKEINARISVLETKMLKLNSLLLLNNISKTDKLQGIKELLIASSNLNLQINKKLEFDANDIFKPN